MACDQELLSSAPRLPPAVGGAKPRRRVVRWQLPGLIADIVGHPGLYGLAAFREHRSDVIEELLLRGLTVVGERELDRARWEGR